MTLTPETRAQLRAQAEDAAPWPYRKDVDTVPVGPTTVLALLDALDEAERESDRLFTEAAVARGRQERAEAVAAEAVAIARSLPAIALAAGLPEDARPDDVAQAVADTRGLLRDADGVGVGVTRMDGGGLNNRRIERRNQMDGSVKWVVSLGGHVAHRDGTVEYEPMPSSRDDAFIARTRMSLDEACDSALRIVGVDRERVERVRRALKVQP